MAGIVGIFEPGREDWVQRGLRAISHRGGAGRSASNLANATIGQVWPEGQAGFAAGAERATAVLDGEIHNWPELSAGGTYTLEALQHAFGEQGPRFVAAIDGPFAFAVASDGEFLLARDRVGKSPLYYGTSAQGTICFSSEMKCLLD